MYYLYVILCNLFRYFNYQDPRGWREERILMICAVLFGNVEWQIRNLDKQNANFHYDGCLSMQMVSIFSVLAFYLPIIGSKNWNFFNYFFTKNFNFEKIFYLSWSSCKFSKEHCLEILPYIFIYLLFLLPQLQGKLLLLYPYYFSKSMFCHILLQYISTFWECHLSSTRGLFSPFSYIFHKYHCTRKLRSIF